MITVAVYGSLKKGYPNNGVFPPGSTYLQNFTIYNKYKMVSLGGFPGVYHEKGSSILVELWEVPDLTALDRLESNGRFYTRELTSTPIGDAWIYVLPKKEYMSREPVDDGVW